MLFAFGGFRRRPGGRFWVDLSRQTVLVPFGFSSTQLYLLALQDSRINVYYIDGNGDVAAGTDITSSVPYTAADLEEIKWTIAGDKILLFHKDYETRVVTRTGATTFAISIISYTTDSTGREYWSPYYKYADANVTIDLAATSGTGIACVASEDTFTSNHVGARIRIKISDDWYYMSIASYVDAQNITVDIDGKFSTATLPNHDANEDWEIEQYNDENGYPTCGVFHKNSLWLFGGIDRPNAMNKSLVGEFFNFDLGNSNAGEGINEALAGVETIRSCLSGRNLQIFTDKADYYVADSALTPETFDAKRANPYGVRSKGQPIFHDSASLYIQSNGKAVRESIYDDVQQSYDAAPASVMSPHLIKKPKSQCATRGNEEDPEQFAFFANETDGTIAAFLSMRSQKIGGWMNWETDGTFESLATLDDDGDDRVFFVAKRTIDETTVYYLEEFDWDYTLDAAERVTISGSTASGLTHLAGETVHVRSGNYYIGTFDVDGSGNIDISPVDDTDVTDIECGLNYNLLARPNPPEFALKDGPTTTVEKRIELATIHYESALHFEVAYTGDDNGEEFIARQATDDVESAPTPQEGQAEFEMLGWDFRPSFDLIQDVPLPIIVKGFTMEVAM